jgi:hypothetical protein
MTENFINKLMLTKEQEKWIDHLSDVEKIKIISYNPKTAVVFNK